MNGYRILAKRHRAAIRLHDESRDLVLIGQLGFLQKKTFWETLNREFQRQGETGKSLNPHQEICLPASAKRKNRTPTADVAVRLYVRQREGSVFHYR